jgi:hypothetical protein
MARYPGQHRSTSMPRLAREGSYPGQLADGREVEHPGQMRMWSSTSHNHPTRDIKKAGVCPACDDYLWSMAITGAYVWWPSDAEASPWE